MKVVIIGGVAGGMSAAKITPLERRCRNRRF